MLSLEILSRDYLSSELSKAALKPISEENEQNSRGTLNEKCISPFSAIGSEALYETATLKEVSIFLCALISCHAWHLLCFRISELRRILKCLKMILESR